MRNTINDYAKKREVKHWENEIISWEMTKEELKKSGYSTDLDFLVYKFSNGLTELELFCDLDAPVGYRYCIFIPGKSEQEGNYQSKGEAISVILRDLKIR